MMKSSLYEYSNAYIIMKRNRSVTNTVAADADAINTNKKLIFKNFVPFTTHKQQTLHININTFNTAKLTQSLIIMVLLFILLLIILQIH